MKPPIGPKAISVHPSCLENLGSCTIFVRQLENAGFFRGFKWMEINVATGFPGGTFCMFSIFQVGFVLFLGSQFYKMFMLQPTSRWKPQTAQKKAPTSRRMQSRSVAVRSKNPRSVGSFGGENDCEIPGSTFWSVQGWVKHKKKNKIYQKNERDSGIPKLPIIVYFKQKLP